MKKFFFIAVLIIPLFSNAQKVQNVKTNQVVELKESVSEYCSIVMQPMKGSFGFFIALNELGFWKPLDNQGNQIDFKTIVEAMNFMSDNGWKYVGNIGGSGGSAPQYFFKKKEA